MGNNNIPEDRTEDMRDALEIARKRAEADNALEEATILEQNIPEDNIPKDNTLEENIPEENISEEAVLEEIVLEEVTLEEENALEKSVSEAKQKKTISDYWKAFKRGAVCQTILIIIGLTICGALGAGIAVLEDRMDPFNVANAYFQAYILSNFDDMYQYVQVKEGTFINNETFGLLMQSERSMCSIGEYEVGEAVVFEGTAVTEVTYTNELTGSTEMFTINMVEHRDNWYQIIPDWNVVIDDAVIEDIMINVINGADVNIDGISAEEYYVSTDEEELVDTYVIDRMLKGEHSIYVATDYGERTLTNDISESNMETVVNSEGMELKDDIKSILLADSEETIENLYKLCMKQNKSYKKILDDYADNKSVKKAVSTAVNKIRATFFDEEVKDIDQYFVSDMEFGNIDTSVSYTYPDVVNITSKFQYNYTASMDTTYYSSYTGEYSGTVKATVKFTYELNDGEWQITDVTVKNKIMG
ncbi:MAG: hypothetical protein ACI4DS_02675 [Eubacterium sp.]